MGNIKNYETKKRGLIKKIEFLKEIKRNLIKDIQDLKDKQVHGKISYEEYRRNIDYILKGKNLEGWLKYYNESIEKYKDHLLSCERHINNSKIKNLNYKILTISVLLAFGILMFLNTINLPEKITGYSIAEIEDEDDYEIHLKSREFTPQKYISKETRIKFKNKAFQDIKKNHAILQLKYIPDEKEKGNLEREGIKLLSYIPENSWFVSIDNENIDKISKLKNVRWLDEILIEDKISLSIREHGFNEFSKNQDGTINLTVLFFKDISLEEAKNIISKYGAVTGEAPIINALIINIPNSSFVNLVNEDFVQWIEDVPAIPIELNDGVRPVIGVDFLQTNYGLNGTNVTVGEWDSGHADSTHDDFGNRITYGDSASVTDHSTHVAGIVLSDGRLSTNQQYRGMAPNATLISYQWWLSVSEANSDYNAAINTYGIKLSTNSWGWVDQGVYDSRSQVIDSIVYGNITRPITIVWAAGNERAYSRCDYTATTYDCIIIPATAKNTITVGATTKSDTMTYFSSWGPTDDGRIKPDIVAPGQGVTSTVSTDAYATYDGTSIAAPAVAGGITLLLQEYFNKTGNLDILPSTIKALLVQTAKDLGDIGPDFSFGYGRVNFTDATNLLKQDSSENNIILNNTIMEQGNNNTYYITIQTETRELKITLAWDDYPGTPNAAKELVNDLDLIIIAPNGTKYYPWTLPWVYNASSPGDAAVRNRSDDTNNVEQVYVGNPITGRWNITINGTTIPNSNQTYSIVSSTALLQQQPQQLVVTLEQPINNHYTNNSIVTFNCSATASNLKNMSLYHNISGNFIINQTRDIGGSSNSSTFSINHSLPLTFIWNCLAFDVNSNSDWGDSNYSVTINPNINTSNIYAPTVSTINLTPLQPRSYHTLNCSYTIQDNDVVNTEFDVNISFHKNNTKILTLKNSSRVLKYNIATEILQPGNLTKDDVWSCGAIPYDYVNFGNETFSNNVTILNSAPTLILNMPDQTWIQDTTLTINLSKYFTDYDNENLSYSSTNVDSINISIDNNTAIITLTPSSGFTGTRNVVFTAYDTNENTNSNIVVLTINPSSSSSGGSGGGGGGSSSNIEELSKNEIPSENQIEKTPIEGPVKSEEREKIIEAQTSCNDGIKNQDEQDIDCGGPCLPCENVITGRVIYLKIFGNIRNNLILFTILILILIYLTTGKKLIKNKKLS